MFEQDSGITKYFTRIAFLLAAVAFPAAGTVCSAAGGDNGAIEGTWITSLTTPAGNMLLTLTVSPLDLAQTGRVNPRSVVSAVLDWETLPEKLVEGGTKPVFVRKPLKADGQS